MCTKGKLCQCYLDGNRDGMHNGKVIALVDSQQEIDGLRSELAQARKDCEEWKERTEVFAASLKRAYETRDGLRLELDQVRAELSREHAGQVCDHCLRCIASGGEGTSYCVACEDDDKELAQVRVWSAAWKSCAKSHNDVNELDREIDCIRLRFELAQARAEIKQLRSVLHIIRDEALSPLPDEKAA
jgi:hypothetical protein